MNTTTPTQQELTTQHKKRMMNTLRETTPTTQQELLSFNTLITNFILTHPTLTTQETKELTLLREITNYNYTH